MRESERAMNWLRLRTLSKLLNSLHLLLGSVADVLPSTHLYCMQIRKFHTILRHTLCLSDLYSLALYFFRVWSPVLPSGPQRICEKVETDLYTSLHTLGKYFLTQSFRLVRSILTTYSINAKLGTHTHINARFALCDGMCETFVWTDKMHARRGDE